MVNPLSFLAWCLLLAVREKWAHWRGRVLLLSESDADRLIEIGFLPGIPPSAAIMPRDLEAARRALVRVNLGADADVATATLWDAFRVCPSDIVGYPGPVRMVFLHLYNDHLTAIPWPVPREVVDACYAATEIQAVFEDDEPEDSLAGTTIGAA